MVNKGKVKKFLGRESNVGDWLTSPPGPLSKAERGRVSSPPLQQ
jgi:hypothetical protein